MASHRFAEAPAHLASDPRRGGVLRAIALVLVAIVGFGGSLGYLVWDALAGDVKDQGMTSGALANVPFPDDSFEGRPINILVIGTDQRTTEGYLFGDADTENGAARSDTTMIAHVSADRSRIDVVSIPRDLLTAIPDCTRSDGTYIPGESFGMFNTAFSNGAGDANDLPAGVACTKSAAETVTGFTMDAFIMVNIGTLVQMVDAIGGVWFQVPEAVESPEADLSITAGCHKLDGTTFAQYARARHNYVEGTTWDGSDTMRMQRQQQLVAALLREVLSKNVFTDAPSLIAFVRQAVSALSLSPNLADLNADVGLLRSVAGIDRANIHLLTMPTSASMYEEGRLEATEPLASQIWAALAADQPLPVGTEYKDGYGVEQIVPDPAAVAAAQSAAAAAPADPAAPAAPVDPAAPATDPAAPAAPATTAPAETCPPPGQN